MRTHVIHAAAAAAVVSITSQVFAASSEYTTPNVVTGTAPVTTTLGGYTFVNKGLQGVGRLSAELKDTWTIPGTSTVVHETLGSVSGMQLTNWQATGNGSYTGTFNTLPDRGYNATNVFSDYAARIQNINFTFTPYTGAANIGGVDLASRIAAQNQIVPTYASTDIFTYANPNQGNALTTTTGLNPLTNTSTVLGQVTPLATTQTIGLTNVPVNKLAIDAEALVLLPDGSGYVSDEYGPNIYHFNAAKQIDAIVTLPEAVRPRDAANNLVFDSQTGVTKGRRGNQGMEGMALSPDGKTLYALLQSATLQDSNASQQNRNNTRLMVYDVSADALNPTLIAEHAMELPRYTSNGGGGAVNRTAAQSELVALPDGKVLVLARDGNGLAAGDVQPVYKSILMIDTVGASNFAGTTRDDIGGKITTAAGVLDASITPVTQQQVLNMLNSEQLAKFNINLGFNTDADPELEAMDQLTISEKWEGLSLVPALDPANPNDYFLFIANDNDFSSTTGQMLQADGSYFTYDSVAAGDPLSAVNDTVFLAYRVTIIPEPVSVGMLGIAGLGLLRRRR